MRMFALAPEQIEQTWEDYRGLVEQFERSTGEMTAAQVKKGALEGTLQIWGLQDAEKVHGVLATEVIETARGLVCVIRVAIGNAPVGYQKRLLDEVGRWAKGMGCVSVRIIGRKGWLRRFPFFRKTAVVAEWNLRAN